MRYVNKQDSKDQVERFGMVVRDKDFFEKSEKTLKEFIENEPENKKADIKSFDGGDNAKG